MYISSGLKLGIENRFSSQERRLGTSQIIRDSKGKQSFPKPWTDYTLSPAEASTGWGKGTFEWKCLPRDLRYRAQARVSKEVSIPFLKRRASTWQTYKTVFNVSFFCMHCKVMFLFVLKTCSLFKICCA